MSSLGSCIYLFLTILDTVEGLIFSSSAISLFDNAFFLEEPFKKSDCMSTMISATKKRVCCLLSRPFKKDFASCVLLSFDCSTLFLIFAIRSCDIKLSFKDTFHESLVFIAIRSGLA